MVALSVARAPRGLARPTPGASLVLTAGRARPGRGRPTPGASLALTAGRGRVGLGRQARACSAMLVAAGVFGLGRPATAATAAAPHLQARAAILVEHDLGVTVFGRAADAGLPIGSTTKLMTAYVALHRAPLTRILTVQPYAAAPAETVAGLRAGERLSVGDLLAAMLLPSGGDAAHTLAVGLAGSVERFVGWMNRGAADLHLDESHFSTEVGLDTSGNYSSANDLARLTGVLLANPYFARTVARTRVTLADGLTVHNRNDLVGEYAFVIGVKTGHTNAAGYCLVAAGRRDGATVITVVLGDPTTGARDTDSLALLRYGLSLYRGVEAVHRGRVYATVPVDGRPGERLALVAQRSATVVLRRGGHLALTRHSLAAFARGPLQKGTVLGQLTVKLDGRVVAEVPLVSRSPLAPAPAAAKRIVLAGGLIGGVLLVVGCSLLVMHKGRGER